MKAVKLAMIGYLIAKAADQPEALRALALIAVRVVDGQDDERFWRRVREMCE